MRYSATERLGVIETDRIVTKYLKWIFREQPIVDVGIDAILEQVDNGKPLGKFIAVQVKSGEKNFYITEKHLIYYVSNIHYNYWLNLNIPIIIVAYLPSTNNCYWEIIDKSTLKKTKQKWKINIPKDNVFSNSENILSKYLLEIKTNDIFEKIYHYDFENEFSEEANDFMESSESTARLGLLFVELNKKTAEFDKKNRSLIEIGYTSRDSRLKGFVKLQSRYLTSISYRLTSENKIFSEAFPEELYLLEQLIYSAIHDEIKIPKDLTSGIKLMEKSLKDMSISIENWVDISKSISKNTIKRYPSMKVAKISLVGALEASSYEYSEASLIVKKLISRVDLLIKT